MKTRNFAMAGAALLLLATPAVAGQSTAAKREATRQLNLQAAQQAQSSNQAGTPQPPQFADATANLPADSPPAAAPAAQAQSASIANPDGAAPVVLSSILHPSTKIASANVLDSDGQTVGAVQRVDMTPEGAPTRVAVALIGKDEKTVMLDAGAVKYDPARNEILAQQSGDQIKALPSAG